MKKLTIIVASIVAMLGVAITPLVPATVYAQSSQVGEGACKAQNGTWNDTTKNCDGVENGDLMPIIKTVINIMLFIVGILSVIMIVFGGIRYVTSAGNKTAVDSAKNTIIYSVVGLVVAIVAFALVNWVFSSITTPVPAPAPTTPATPTP
jgi:hypothetical protein